jgi:hypothetical protein
MDNDRTAADYGEPAKEQEGDWDGHEDDVTFEPYGHPQPTVLEDGWKEEEPAQIELSEDGKRYEQKMMDEPAL